MLQPAIAAAVRNFWCADGRSTLLLLVQLVQLVQLLVLLWLGSLQQRTGITRFGRNSSLSVCRCSFVAAGAVAVSAAAVLSHSRGRWQQPQQDLQDSWYNKVQSPSCCGRCCIQLVSDSREPREVCGRTKMRNSSTTAAASHRDCCNRNGSSATANAYKQLEVKIRQRIAPTAFPCTASVTVVAAGVACAAAAASSYHSFQPQSDGSKCHFQ